MVALLTRKKNNRLTSPLRLAVAIFFSSLQRQEMQFLTLRLEGHITGPYKCFRQLSSRQCSFFASVLILQGVVGMEVIHPLLPLRWPLGSGFLVSLAKILEPISGQAEHQGGYRDRGSML